MTDISGDKTPHHLESSEPALIKRHVGVKGLDGDVEHVIIDDEPAAPEPAVESIASQSPEDAKAARRAQMLSNLERGRKTAMENRRKRALLKKLAKEEKQQMVESELKAKLLSKQTQEDEVSGLKEEITRLKAEATGRNDGLKEQELQRLKEELKELKSAVQKPKPSSPRAKEPKPEPKVNPIGLAPNAKPKPVQPEVEVYRTFVKAPW